MVATNEGPEIPAAHDAPWEKIIVQTTIRSDADRRKRRCDALMMRRRE